MTEGCIPPLSDLLEVHDAKIVTVALEGLENILKVRRPDTTDASSCLVPFFLRTGVVPGVWRGTDRQITGKFLSPM